MALIKYYDEYKGKQRRKLFEQIRTQFYRRVYIYICLGDLGCVELRWVTEQESIAAFGRCFLLLWRSPAESKKIDFNLVWPDDASHSMVYAKVQILA